MSHPKITILLLPGLNGTAGLFKPLVDTKPDHFDLVIVTYPTHEKKSYSDLLLIIESHIKNITTPFIILGESFGGPLALFASQRRPKNLIGLILVATFINAPNFKFAKYLPWTFGFMLTKPLYSIRLALSRDSNSSFIKAASTELQKVSPFVLADRIKSIFNVNAHHALISCPVPIIYFRGKHDFVVPQKNLTRIKTINPSVQTATFNTQHFLLQSSPIEAWQVISNFIKNINTAAV